MSFFFYFVLQMVTNDAVARHIAHYRIIRDQSIAGMSYNFFKASIYFYAKLSYCGKVLVKKKENLTPLVFVCI